MNLKTFAQQARTLLMEGVAKKIIYWGFDPLGNLTQPPQAVQGGYLLRGEVYDDPDAMPRHKKLREAIRLLGVREVVEEAAYTWFNRMVALKILSANQYELPPLDYAQGNDHLPQLLQRARRGEYTQYLSANEQTRLLRVLNDYTKDTAAFGILLTGYCHAHPLIQRVFGTIDDYTELLLPDDILDSNGFLHLLNTTDAITAHDYQRVELIGWLYQFYISERKDEVFAAFKKNQKAEAKDIPAATQIFTPNWIVKYMVQNTVGKLWLDHRPDSAIRPQLKYLVESSDTTQNHTLVDDITHLKLLDPAVGSGHILVEGFDLLYDIYEEEYYTPQEAVEHILQHNLFGLDIDKRAAQLARFAVLLKAAKRYPAILKTKLLPQIYAMPDPRPFSRQELFDFLGEQGYKYEEELAAALQLMQEAQNLGSTMQLHLSSPARAHLQQRWQQLETQAFRSFTEETLLQSIRPYLQVLMLLTQPYEAIVANPPYMGAGNMNEKLKNYVTIKYPRGKGDLMTVFMEVIPKLAVRGGRFGIINLPSWLFLSSFEALRYYYLDNFHIESLLHMGRGIFGIDFGSVAFCVQKEYFKNQTGNYFRLHERNFQHIHFNDIEKLFLFSNGKPNFKYDFSNYRDEDGTTEIPLEGTNVGLRLFYSNIPQQNFAKIPGNPFAYWVSNNSIDLFAHSNRLESLIELRTGITTGNNEIYMKYWFEVGFNKIQFDNPPNSRPVKGKWLICRSGAPYKKWFGELLDVVDWEKDGINVKNNPSCSLRSAEYWFLEGLSWSKISSNKISVRFSDPGYLFDAVGLSGFAESRVTLLLIIAILNSKIADFFIKVFNSSMSILVSDVGKVPLPFIYTNYYKKFVDNKYLTELCISLSRKDWDSRETSWDFAQSPLLERGASLPQAYQHWQREVTQDFFQLHANEEELNRIFIALYGLQDELTPEVALKDITILQDELDTNALVALEPRFREQGAVELPIKREVVMQQLISYVIGCLMGRYRLGQSGLHIAHPQPTEAELASYTYHGQKVEIDPDAIIPLMGSTADFPDDAVPRFKQCLDLIWGEDTRIANLNFVEECLNQDIEKFLVKDFWKVHCSMYKKKPIYWLFASPKGAFQVLVYMHRMNAFTVEKIRSNYLMEHLRHLRTSIEHLSAKPSPSRDDAKRLDKLRADLLECETYDLHLKTVADAQIEFDLDEGVTKNHEKFKPVVAPIK